MITPRAIAAFYDVPLCDCVHDIRASLEQSKENAGKHGKSRLDYFDGYMVDLIGCARAEALAHRDFARNAY